MLAMESQNQSLSLLPSRPSFLSLAGRKSHFFTVSDKVGTAGYEARVITKHISGNRSEPLPAGKTVTVVSRRQVTAALHLSPSRGWSCSWSTRGSLSTRFGSLWISAPSAMLVEGGSGTAAS